MKELFDRESFEQLSPQSQQNEADKIYKNIINIINAARNIQNQGLIYLLAPNNVDEIIIGFSHLEEQQLEWNRKWNDRKRQRSPDSITDQLEIGVALVNEYIALISRIAPHFVSAEAVAQRSVEQLEGRVGDIMSQCTEKITVLTDDVKKLVTDGIQQLSEFKAELGLSGSLSKKLSRKRISLTCWSFVMAISYIAVLVLMALVLSGVWTPIKTEIINQSIAASIAFRLGLAVPALLIARFLLMEYRRAASVRAHADHLERLLNGGATYISELLESDANAKKAAYEQLAELFIHAYRADIMAHNPKGSEQNFAMNNNTLRETLDSVGSFISNVKGK